MKGKQILEKVCSRCQTRSKPPRPTREGAPCSPFPYDQTQGARIPKRFLKERRMLRLISEPSFLRYSTLSIYFLGITNAPWRVRILTHYIFILRKSQRVSLEVATRVDIQVYGSSAGLEEGRLTSAPRDPLLYIRSIIDLRYPASVLGCFQKSIRSVVNKSQRAIIW